MRKPLQVYLEEADLARLERWSSERRVTKSQVVRAALRAFTRPRAADPVLELSGIAEGLPPDASERFDHYLTETLVAERPPAYRRRRAAKPAARR